MQGHELITDIIPTTRWIHLTGPILILTISQRMVTCVFQDHHALVWPGGQILKKYCAGGSRSPPGIPQAHSRVLFSHFLVRYWIQQCPLLGQWLSSMTIYVHLHICTSTCLYIFKHFDPGITFVILLSTGTCIFLTFIGSNTNSITQFLKDNYQRHNCDCWSQPHRDRAGPSQSWGDEALLRMKVQQYYQKDPEGNNTVRQKSLETSHVATFYSFFSKA